MSIELHVKRFHNELDNQGIQNTKQQKVSSDPFEIAELQSTIFSYIPPASKDWANCTLVCHNWNQAITHCALLKQQLKSISSLTYKEIQDWQIISKNCYKKDLSIAEIIKECTNLKKLDLSDSSITNDAFKDIISYLNPALEEFYLKNCRELTYADFNTLTSLEKLDIRKCPELTIVKTNQLSSLKFLKFCECMSLDIDREKDLPDPLPSAFQLCERVLAKPGLYAHSRNRCESSIFTSHGFAGA